MKPNQSSLMLKGTIVVVILVVVIAVIAWYAGSDTSPANQNALNPTQSTSTNGNNSSSAGQNSYQDGTYSAEGNYISPAGREEIDITLTLENNVVTEAEFTGRGTNPTTRQMQEKFNDGFAEEVVGVPIDQISLSVVNGSSLTPKGFMDALEEIKSQASVS